MHNIDILIIVIYLSACVFVGIFKSKRITNIKEYTLGGENFSSLVLTATIFATAVNATTTVGKAGIIYNLGLSYGIPSIMISIAWLLTALIFTKNISRFKGCISINEIMQKLYGAPGLWLSSICVMIDSISLITIQITAIGFLFKYFFNMSYELGAILGFSVLTFYSAIGGVRAVAFTDLLQFLIFFIAFPMALGILYYDIGGYTGLTKTLPSSYFSIMSEEGTIWLFLGYLFYYIMPSISAPNIQRMLIAKNKEQLFKTCTRVAILFPVFNLIILFLSMCIKAKDPNLEANTVLYYFIGNYLPYGIVGIMVSGMLAVMMSTADSWLNCSSSTIAHDFIKNIFPNITERQELRIARIATCIIAVISVIVALKVKKILEVVWATRNFIFPVIYIPFIAGIMGFRTNIKSFISGIIFGLISCFISRYYTGEFGIISLCSGKIGSAIGLFGMHYWQLRKGVIFSIKDAPYKLQSPSYKERIKSILKNIVDTKYQLERFKANYQTFALVILLSNIPLSIFYYNPNSGYLGYSINSIRVLSVLTCFFLYFYEYWLAKEKEGNIIWLWYFCLFICLPFLSSYMAIVTNFNAFWIVYCLLSLMLLSFFTSTIIFSISTTTGVLLAYILYKVINYRIGENLYLENLNYTWYAAYLCGVIALMLSYYIYRRHVDAQQEQRSLTTLGMSIAHEANTPLSIGLMETTLIKAALEEKAYNKAKRLILEQEQVMTQGLQDLRVILNSLGTEDKFKDWGTHSIIKTVNEAINSYYMTPQERERIAFIEADNFTKDFIYIGSSELFKLVIFNLIKNAFKYAGSEATICIWIEDRELYFHDNGRGMSPTVMENIFKKYYTESRSGNGIGLNFCKEVMKKMGGDITCKSELNLGTTFILSF